MGLTAASYIKMLRGLLPRGIAWEAPSGSNFYKFLQAIADELLRLDGSVSGAIDEADPQTTTDLISDWERVVGIPDPCTGVSSTLVQRRRQIIARLSARGGQSPQFFIDLALAIGYVVTIEEFDKFVAGSKAGDRLYNGDWVFAWRVNATSNQQNTFRAGYGRAGERLSFSTDSSLECLIGRHKPAHTILLFSYT